MMKRQIAENALAVCGKRDVYLPAILCAPAALNEISFLEPADQLDRAVVPNLQAFSKIGNAGTVFTPGAANCEHELMVLGLYACLARCFLAEMEKSAYLIAKISKRPVIGGLQIVNRHSVSVRLYRIAI